MVVSEAGWQVRQDYIRWLAATMVGVEEAETTTSKPLEIQDSSYVGCQLGTVQFLRRFLRTSQTWKCGGVSGIAIPGAAAADPMVSSGALSGKVYSRANEELQGCDVATGYRPPMGSGE